MVLNSQFSSWQSIKSRVPLGQVLIPLFFLIRIKDLQEGINSEVKRFANDNSLVSIVKGANGSPSILASDLYEIQG